jgi:uncharacterized membrane protein YbhN (UPF0104 family)
MSTAQLASKWHSRTRGLRRDHVWALIWIGLVGAAVYLLLPELSGLQESLRSLHVKAPGWLIVGAALVALRYVLGTVSLGAAVARSLPLGPMLLVQVATSFIGRLTPEGVGWFVLNQRYLERAGVERASALAAVALRVLAAGVTRLAIAAGIVAIAGTRTGVSIELPDLRPFALGLAVVGTLIIVALRLTFRSAASRAIAPVISAARDLATVFRQPGRALLLLGGAAGLTLTSGLVLATSLLAFGAEVSLIDVFAVYLAGTAVAAASPTPGNVGAVEVALSAGLTAAGAPSAAAVAAVLIYRLLTFWLPLLPGVLAFRYLQAKHYL